MPKTTPSADSKAHLAGARARPRRTSFSQIWRDPGDAIAFGLGTGCAPWAPGTFGTLLGLALYLALQPLPPTVYLGICATGFAIGCWLCGRSARRLGVHDHPGIVLDEIIGYLLTMAAYQYRASGAGSALADGGTGDEPGLWSTGWFGDDLLWAVVGFALFRLFDIRKPWPVGWLDRRVHGGTGIMLDDAAAGLMALLVLELLLALAASI